MSKKIYILFTLCCITIANCYAQNNYFCGPGNGHQGAGQDDQGNSSSGQTQGYGSADPNLILSPIGFDTARWVSINDHMGFTIYFENDPQLATAPAQIVYIYYRFDNHQDATSFRLSDFGFNGMIFPVPPNLNFYQVRLDLRDSLGLYVDVTAGINVITNTAFWIFQSIDPLTNQPPLDPLSGFLPVKDSTLSDSLAVKGEGFVNFTIKPLSSSHSRDTIFATAQIVFDVNDTIATNTEFNTIDALAPNSLVTVSNIDSVSIQLHIQATDDINGCGVRDYDLYVSQDSTNYITYLTHVSDSVINFTGSLGSTYRFFSIATDNVGNREQMKGTADITVVLGEERKWFQDADGDEYGNIFRSLIAFYQPDGYVLDSTDCNDHDPFVRTGCTELCPDGNLSLTSDLTGTVYQWQLNTGSGFVNISDNINYTGTNAPTIQLNNIPSSWYGYAYRCLADGFSSQVFSLKFISTWSGTVSTAWETAANWGCGNVPDAYTDVIIVQAANQPVISSNRMCRSIKQQEGTNVHVNANFNLNITGPP